MAGMGGWRQPRLAAGDQPVLRHGAASHCHRMAVLAVPLPPMHGSRRHPAGDHGSWRTGVARPATYLETKPDDELIMAVGSGVEDALRVLYTRHTPGMLRLIRRLTSDPSVAEEILQETWLAVWRGADTFRGDSSVHGWLLGVARRQAHNRLRRGRLPTVHIDEAADVPDAVDVEATVLAAAGAARVARAIAALPEHLREVAILVLVDELPYRDVAAAAGIPVGTVKSRMSHARGRLAQELAHGAGAGATAESSPP